MTTTLRTVATIVLVSAVLLGALAATGYTFRERLADTPIVGAVVDRLGWRAEMDPPDAPYWTCPMHPDMHEHGPGVCPICGMSLEAVDPPAADAGMGDMGMASSMPDPMPATPVPAAVGSPRAEVNIDPRRQQLIGVRTAPVERRVLTKSIRAVGTVRYDETRLADVNVKVAGWIEELYVDYTGQFIEAGQPLFTLYSPELLTTQQEYLLALESRAQLRASQIADARGYADRLVDAARQRLILWDLPLDEIEALEERREPRRTMLFRAPVGGFVIEKRVP